MSNREIARACYLRNKDRYDKANTEWYENNPKSRLLINAKRRAKQKGLEFSVTIDDFEIPEKCPILGVAMIRRTRYAPSLDRIDSAKGYIEGNVQVLSTLANTMKNNASSDELKAFAIWVIRNY